MANPDSQNHNWAITSMSGLDTPFLCTPDLHQGFLPMPVRTLPSAAVYFSEALRQNTAASTRNHVINCSSQIQMLEQECTKSPLKILQKVSSLAHGSPIVSSPWTQHIQFPCDFLGVICIPGKGVSLKLAVHTNNVSNQLSPK